MEVVTDTNIDNKKALKKRFCSVGANLLVREVFMFLSGIMVCFGYAIYYAVKNNGLDDGNSMDVIKALMENPLINIIPVLIGFMPVMYFIKRYVGKQRILTEKKKFTLKTVFIFFVLLLGVSYSCDIFSTLMENGLNAMGLTMAESEEMLKSFDIPAMLLYTVLVGPIVEELIYRGMVLRFLDQFDKGVAIVGSGVLFGLMHANFYQIFMAIGIGIFLGYIAEEYSIKLTIILHMIFNAFSFSAVKLVEKLSTFNISEDVVSGVIVAVSIIVLVVAVIKNLQKIKIEFAKYKPEKEMCIYFFTSFSVILLMAVNLIEAFSQISKI